jgi:hypothetical protein
MKEISFVAVIALCVAPVLAVAEVPCDFKGISVGDKLTPAQIMTKLGVAKFKSNPPRPNSYRDTELIAKHGMTGAAEIQDWEIGPHCDAIMCKAPGVKVGIDINSSVFVLFDKATYRVQAVAVAVNSSNWDDLVSILKNKYGPTWSIEQSDMEIVSLQTKRRTPVHRYEMTHKTGGVNKKSGDRCELSAINYDIIFEHGDPLGLYHSVFEIKLVSTNF